MVDNSPFDLRLFKAKNQIDDALGVNKRAPQQGQMPNQRMPNLGPVPNQRPTQMPGNPQLTPYGVAVSGQQQVGPGMVSGGAMVGPQGFGGGGANYSMPAAGGQFNVGASVDPRLKMAQLQAQYQLLLLRLRRQTGSPTILHSMGPVRRSIIPLTTRRSPILHWI